MRIFLVRSFSEYDFSYSAHACTVASFDTHAEPVDENHFYTCTCSYSVYPLVDVVVCV